MKEINTKKLKAIIAFSIIVMVLIFILIAFLKNKNKASVVTQDSPVLQMAPSSILNKTVLKESKTKKNNYNSFDDDYKTTNEYKENLENIISPKDNKKDGKNDFAPQNSTTTAQAKDKTNNQSSIQNLNLKTEAKIASKTPINDSTTGITYTNDGIIKSLNQNPYDVQNAQDKKKEFIAQTNSNDIDYLTEFDIAPGTIIPIVLITSINSDLPGEIIGQVSTNIYDTLTHTNILIPKGTRVLAKYDSQISYGQERILIIWNMLIREDGVVLNLPSFQGVDNNGANGYKGKTDNHFSSMISTASLSSIIDLAQSGISNLTNNDTVNAFLSSIGSTSSTLGKEILQKSINRQPTITIEKGKSEKILINKKISLPPLDC